MNALPYRERVLPVACESEPLLAVLTEPAAAQSPAIGVLIVVGGPQYRVGSHRQFVLLARELARAGHACLRFDVRGMGDAGGEMRSFEALDADIHAALQAWRADAGAPGKLVLWGLCDGASAALLYLHAQQSRGLSGDAVQGLCLLNPWVRSAEGQARAQVKHYYWDRLRQRGFWTKLLSGKVALSALSGLLRALRQARQTSPAAPSAYQARMANGLQQFAGPTLLLLSEHDYTAKEFQDHCSHSPQWQELLRRPQIQQSLLNGADHTLSSRAAEQQMFDLLLAWLERLP
ncbi:hydrolase 1, exosortase A system-associated [Paucibacter sediminis]|uniref:Hydrolase 1, exosortase A system-associated n=1 Tax=Paucibacter sediminis TaxID=3019553 RepID=A0AA95SVC8_9BURK|nr:hydrolase 1, exosortase A system-associated [Paucibacter sp. S2-9]WIT11329.1 hydrolase 1, exosortase A system-associated [Paucibacter sp. S2-9]